MLRGKFILLLGLGSLGAWCLPPFRATVTASPPPSADLIRQAVRQRRLLNFVYSDHSRTVEPHALGRTRDGQLAILAWQVAGGSTSEPPPGWRTFIAAEIGHLALAAETFPGPRPDYRAERSGLAEIELEVISEPAS